MRLRTGALLGMAIAVLLVVALSGAATAGATTQILALGLEDEESIPVNAGGPFKAGYPGPIQLSFKLKGKRQCAWSEALLMSGTLSSANEPVDRFTVEDAAANGIPCETPPHEEIEARLHKEAGSAPWTLSASSSGSAELTATSGELKLVLDVEFSTETSNVLYECHLEAAALRGTNDATATEILPLTFAFPVKAKHIKNQLVLNRTDSSPGCPKSVKLGFEFKRVKLGKSESGGIGLYEYLEAPAPALTIEKLQEVAGSGSGYSTSTRKALVGETVDYEIIVKNTGNVPLRFSSLNDEHCEVNTLTGGPGAAPLEPGSSTTYQCQHKVTAEDAIAGSYKNTATATAMAPAGTGSSITHSSNTVEVEVP